MTLFLRLGVAGISTPGSFRCPQPVKMSISIASSPRLSGTGMTSLNPGLLLLNCQMIVYLSLGWDDMLLPRYDTYRDTCLAIRYISRYLGLFFQAVQQL